ncbi:hypothetical protein [Coxiella-like endosymbiont]
MKEAVKNGYLVALYDSYNSTKKCAKNTYCFI